MENASKNRWLIRGAAVLIFVLGFASGMLALNAYRSWARNRNVPEDRMEQLAKRLTLDADQKKKVQEIFGDTREKLSGLRKESEPKMAEIRRQADERLQQVLNADQWKRFQQMRDEMRQRRGRGPRPDNR